jgi:hypothetical protein
MANKRDKPVESEPQSLSAWWRVIAMGAVALVGGLGLAIGSGVYTWQDSEKADRLRTTGAPVTAAVSDFYDGSGRGSGPDAITVTYTYEGKQYQKRIRCGGGTGCHSEPAPQTTVWVDPEKPSEFVAANGNTDGSLSFFNSWMKVVVGLLVAVIGAVGLVLAFFGNRLIAWNRARKRRR